MRCAAAVGTSENDGDAPHGDECEEAETIIVLSGVRQTEYDGQMGKVVLLSAGGGGAG